MKFQFKVDINLFCPTIELKKKKKEKKKDGYKLEFGLCKNNVTKK